MASLLSALCLQAALLGNVWDLKLTGDTQLRAGYSYTPFVTGPDAAPLLNVPLSTQGTWIVNFIVTPGIELDLKQRDFTLRAGYSPKFFFDVLNLTTSAPTIFHRLNLDLTWGTPHGWLLGAGALVSLGGLDMGQAGSAVASEFSAGLRPGTNSNALNFFNAGAYLKVEHPIGRDWRFSTQESVSKYDTPPLSAGALLGNNPSSNPNTPSIGGLGAVPLLQSMQRLDSKNELRYKLNDMHSFYLDGLFNIVSFAGTASYIGVTPTLGWETQLSKLTRLTLDAGVMRYITNPFPGIFETPRYLAVFDINWMHTWADVGLPRLQTTLTLQEGPYYDIIYGTLEPRGSITLSGAYAFDRQWEATLQARDYTEAYWNGGWRTIPPGYDKNVAILSGGLKYKYSRWLTYTGGVYGLYRWLQPSATAPYNQLKEIYFFLGVTGSYDVE